jgi:hypothetical protein
VVSGAWRTTGTLAAAAAVAALAALAWLVLFADAHHARAVTTPAAPLPLAPGHAWYSAALDTSAPTVANAERKRTTILRQKWVTRQGFEFLKQSIQGGPPSAGFYGVGDSEPGFGDWDALDVHTLPATAAGIRRLLQSGSLEHGQLTTEQAAERHSPLIWLAQLAAMLTDDPDTPAARDAAFAAIASFPGLEQLGPVSDPRGRAGVAVAERATNLHPLAIATGPGCASPLGGTGCTGVGKPPGSYVLEVIFDPATHAILAVRTTALTAIPAARIAAGTAIYEVSYLQGRVVAKPPIPPAPHPSPPSIQSVPWQLAHVSGRRVTVRWESGTCDPTLKPRPHIKAIWASATVILSVEVHVNTGNRSTACAGVGLGGTLAATLAHPIGDRRILHGRVTDHDR